ncbi:MAG: superoxide dismutase [Candidatus Aenigmarchaeota archaeon]|nr:superoxide dismutase [Candidatus Aenigmarchaeota archaeon]
MHKLPDLPYSYDALEPYIDEQTMRIHHTKHHQAYIDKLNAALEKHPDLQKKAAEELLKGLSSIPEGIRTVVRNHGGGHANHSFFWLVMSPEAGGEPKGPVADAINERFGSFGKFKEEFTNAAMNRFGSGWAWLALGNGKLEIISTANQDSPLSEGKVPILGVDVWEHAYYLKHKSNRAAYVQDFFNVINWEKVNEHFVSAKR